MSNPKIGRRPTDAPPPINLSMGTRTRLSMAAASHWWKCSICFAACRKGRRCACPFHDTSPVEAPPPPPQETSDGREEKLDAA